MTVSDGKTESLRLKLKPGLMLYSSAGGADPVLFLVE